MLVDSHCHLAYPQLADDIDAVVARAREAGVTRLVTISTDLEDGAANLALADRFPDTIRVAVGIHPTSVTEVAGTDWIDRLRQLAAHPAVVAIGETGTDHHHHPPEGFTEEQYHRRQDEFFDAQLALAESLDLPVVVHQRDSFERTVERLEPYHGRVRAVFHCFNRPWSDALPLVERGHLVSFTGIVTFRSAREVQQCARDAAPGSFMVETDAPFLAPVPHRGRRNEPSFVRHTAEHLATLRGIDLESLAAETTDTARAFFRLRDDGTGPQAGRSAGS